MKNSTLKFLRFSGVLFILLLVNQYAWAQTGSLKGIVTDKETGEPLIDVNVSIPKLNRGTLTELDGDYFLPGIPAGRYNIIFNYVGYKADTASVNITAGNTITLNRTMSGDEKQVVNVVVYGEKLTQTDKAVVQEVKESEQVVSAISAEQISKSQDRDAAAVIRRIPGLTIVDNRFVVVRGLSQRYNTVMLNGTLAPSTEAESRAFSFDIIPSSMLDRVLVFKSGSPEIPGEFGGGVIKVYTKNVVEENFNLINITAGYRAGTTFSSFVTQPGNTTQFLSFDDGDRALSEDFPSNIRNLDFNYTERERLTRQFENNWQTAEKTARPDIRVRYDLGRKFNIGNVKASNLSSVSYSNTLQSVDVKRNRYISYDEEGKSSSLFRFNDNQNINNVRLGLISNWSFSFNPQNKIEFRNLYTRFGSTETTIRTGVDDDKGTEVKNYSLFYENRGIYTGQLQGTHTFNKEQTKLTWIAGYNNAFRSQPDWKRASYRRPIGSEGQFQIIIPNNANASDASRFYSDLNEHAFINAADIEHKIGEEKPVKLRMGYYAEYKDRSFEARTLGYTRASSQFNNEILTEPLDSVFTDENIGFPQGMLIAENTKYTDKYTASNLLTAGHAGVVLPFWDKFSLSGGIRVEYNRQQLETAPGPSGQTLSVDNPITSLLPSASLTYNFSNKMQVRGAYSRSLNRPEFRELAPFSFYDFNFEADIVGNPELQIATIDNLDLRWELYPDAGEFIALGTFYKRFQNPIETKIYSGANNPIFLYDNAERATSYGLELEVRKSLDNVSTNNFIQNMSVIFNGSLIQSEIDLGTQRALTQAQKRPLQGQSPYVVNTGIYYQTKETGLQIAVLYNVYGRRIFSVGDDEFPTIYEMPRHLLDLNISKQLTERSELRLGVSDLLNSQLTLREDGNRDGKIDNPVTDKPIMRMRPGQYFTLGFNLKF